MGLVLMSSHVKSIIAFWDFYVTGIFTIVTLCKLGFQERLIHGSIFKWMKFITCMCDLYKCDLRWKSRKFQKKVCAVYIEYCLLRCLSISNNTKPALFVQMSRVFQITPNLKHLGKKQTYQQQHYLLKVSKAIEGRVWFWHLRAFSFTKFIVCVYIWYMTQYLWSIALRCQQPRVFGASFWIDLTSKSQLELSFNPNRRSLQYKLHCMFFFLEGK